MIFSIVILVLLVVCLIIYFVYSSKLKTPTVITELLITKYNKQIEKLKRFLEKNQIKFDCEKFYSDTSKKEVSWEGIRHNIETIKSIENNVNIVKSVFEAKTKAQAEELLQKMLAPCELYEFAGECEQNAEYVKLMEVLGFSKSKLDFEQQRYFGSQFFYIVKDMLVCFYGNEVLLINPKDVFASKICDCKVKIQKKEKAKNEYAISLQIGEEDVKTDLQVPQKDVRAFLEKFGK